jgi:hypothetical protein
VRPFRLKYSSTSALDNISDSLRRFSGTRAFYPCILAPKALLPFLRCTFAILLYPSQVDSSKWIILSRMKSMPSGDHSYSFTSMGDSYSYFSSESFTSRRSYIYQAFVRTSKAALSSISGREEFCCLFSY